MSKKFLLLIAIFLTAFFAACQPNPTRIDSTDQPRDNQMANHSGTNHSTTHNNSVNHEMTNANTMTSNNANNQMMNNSVNQSEMKPESRTNTGN